MPCTKVRYRDIKEARHAIKRIAKADNEGPKPVRAYNCPECGWVHITHIKRENYNKNIMNKLFKSATGKTDDGFQQASFGNAYDGHVYVLTTNRLKADEVPEVMWDAATASQFVAGLLNAYFNDIDVRGIDPGLICDMGKVREEPRPEADTNNIF